MKRAFTLIEITLAMGIMATGVLAIVGLYSYGYRESSQSREDVGATVAADAVLSQLAMAISATNLKWTLFKELRSRPNDEGWGYFVNASTGLVSGNPTSQAKSDFNGFISDLAGCAQGSLDGTFSFPDAALPQGMECGLVILHDRDSSVVRLGFKAMRHKQSLLTAPIFYTEVRFQGIDE